MKKVIVFASALTFGLCVVLADADAATTKHKSSSDYTAAQREKFLAEAWRLCRKKYVLVERVQVDYYHNRYTCWVH